MIYDWKMELYWRLPVFLQERLLSLYAARLDRVYYGPAYTEWRQRYETWKGWSRAEADAWQEEQLRRIITLAATRVPYYRE
ncbi:MAG: hypothetical protein D6736_05925, partial [Nitrospinota bacterium]